MDIKSLYEQLNRPKDGGLVNLFRPTIQYEADAVNYGYYTVQEEDEMRIDLVFQKIYELTGSEVGVYLENIDVLLTLNNIDNPLNIIKGMVIKYPELGSFDSFRFANDEESKSKKKSLAQKLGKPNKKTKTDPARKKYLENDFALPPTVNRKPKQAITIEGGQFKIGGL